MTIIAIIAISTAVLGGAGYGVYKYQEVKKENEQTEFEKIIEKLKTEENNQTVRELEFQKEKRDKEKP